MRARHILVVGGLLLAGCYEKPMPGAVRQTGFYE